MSGPPFPVSLEPDDPNPDTFEARIVGGEREITEAAARFELDVGCRHAHLERREDGSAVLLALASEDQIAKLRSAGYRVEKGENLSARARSLQHEIGTGDRFEGGRVVPRGFGVKTGYGRPGRGS